MFTENKYIIKDGVVEVCNDLLEWARWMEERSADRIVAHDHLTVDDQEVRVSTVFLGLDHNWGDGAPILWETMIFGGINDQYQERYTSRQDAEAGHQLALLAAIANTKLE